MEEEGKPTPLSKLRTAVAQRREERLTAWYTPWSWVDAGRLYYGEDGAWLYMSIPTKLLASGKEYLDNLLKALGTDQGREVHLVAHTWSIPVTQAPDVPQDMLDLLQPALQLPSPRHSCVIGVKLTATDKRDKGGLLDSIDGILGERVPDLTVYDNDRNNVAYSLQAMGVSPLTQQDADHLEYWYTLGSPNDPVVVEEESCIEFGGVSTLVAVSVSEVDAAGQAVSLPGSGRGTAAALSVRGVVRDGALTSPSVVLARRSSSFTTWTDTLEAHNGAIEVQPLPLRQLPAVSETLPCSKVRVNPLMEEFTAVHLRNLGFSTDTAVGDSSGLFIGLSGSDLATLTWWNPLKEFGNLLAVSGGARSGKTFLGEFLAQQAISAGIRVRYLSGDGEAGRPLVEGLAVLGLAAPSPGLADPGSFAYDTVQDEVAALCHLATPAVPRRDWIEVTRRVLLDDPNRTHSTGELTQLLPSTTLAAQVMRAVRNDPVAQMVLEQGPWPSGSVAVSMPHILEAVDQPRLAATTDAVIAAAFNVEDEVPTLVVLDGVTPGPLAAAAVVRAAQRRQPVGIVQLNYDPAYTLPCDSVTKMALWEPDEEQARHDLEWMRLPVSYAQISRLTSELAMSVDDGVVSSPPRYLLRDRRGRVSVGAVAPLRQHELISLSRSAVSAYRE